MYVSNSLVWCLTVNFYYTNAPLSKPQALNYCKSISAVSASVKNVLTAVKTCFKPKFLL